MRDKIEELLARAGSLLLIVCIAIVVIGVFMILAPSQASILQAVESAGYSNAVIAGPDLIAARWNCSEGDFYYYRVVSAINANGNSTNNMYVCAGIFKGFTIRYH